MSDGVKVWSFRVVAAVRGHRLATARVAQTAYVAGVVVAGALGRLDIAVLLTLPVGVLLYPLVAWASLTGFLLGDLLPAAASGVLVWTLLLGALASMALANAAVVCAVGRCLARRLTRAGMSDAAAAPSSSS